MPWQCTMDKARVQKFAWKDGWRWNLSSILKTVWKPEFSVECCILHTEGKKTKDMEKKVLRPDYAKWNQSLEDLRRLSTEADHPRSRERYLALYMIGTEQSNASRWAKEIGRENETVMKWVHKYNEKGPEGVAYQRSGGTPPLLPKRRKRKSSQP